jgi:hypothetical protein
MTECSPDNSLRCAYTLLPFFPLFMMAFRSHVVQGVPYSLPQVCIMVLGPVDAMAREGANKLLQGSCDTGLCSGGQPCDGDSFKRLASLLCLLSQALIHLLWQV